MGLVLLAKRGHPSASGEALTVPWRGHGEVVRLVRGGRARHREGRRGLPLSVRSLGHLL